MIYLKKDLKKEINFTNSISKSDVVISNEFYWVKKENIKVKNEKEATKLAYSFFTKEIENPEDFIFISRKISDGEFYLISIDKKSLIESMKLNNIKSNNIFLAFDYFQNNSNDPISIGDDLIIVFDDEIPIEISKKIIGIEVVENLDFTPNLKSKKINILSNKNDISYKNIFLISFLILLTIFNIFFLKHINTNIENKTIENLSKYDIKSLKQIEISISKYKKIKKNSQIYNSIFYKTLKSFYSFKLKEISIKKDHILLIFQELYSEKEIKDKIKKMDIYKTVEINIKNNETEVKGFF